MKPFLVALIALSCASVARADVPRSVSVSGTCVRGVVPDRGAVVLTAESRDADAKRAQQAATRVYESVRSKTAALRLPDAELSTSEYVSEEVREWEKDRSVLKGYRTRISLRVETSDFSRLSEAIEVGSREGIKQMGGLHLFVSSKKMMEEKTACLKDAADQARAKADALARALGARVGEATSVVEASEAAPQPGPRFAMMKSAVAMDEAASAAPQLEPGKTEISTTVQVTFALK
jgi:uncharacterized protein YggE